MSTRTERTLTHIRRALSTARRESGLTWPQIANRCGCAESTIKRIEGGANPNLVTAITYADAIGLQVAAIPEHLAHLVRLDADDIVHILRAAKGAAEGQRLSPRTATRTGQALDKLRHHKDNP